MIAAEVAVRAWVNGKTATLVGAGLPLSNGAYTQEQRSPASGTYTVLGRVASSTPSPVAEHAPKLAWAGVAFTVYGGTAVTAEAAAVALASAIEALSGSPEPAGPGVTVLAADKLTGPSSVPMAPDTGEVYAFNLSAEFLLAAA